MLTLVLRVYREETIYLLEQFKSLIIKSEAYKNSNRNMLISGVLSVWTIASIVFLSLYFTALFGVPPSLTIIHKVERYSAVS